MANRKRQVARSVKGASRDPAVRAVAASTALAAGGAVAAGKPVRDERTAQTEQKRARRYRLYRDEAPAQAVRRTARGQLDLASELLARRDGDDAAEATHEARKALKRLRALLHVSRGVLDKETYRRENLTLRDTGRSLSAERDAQVLVETLHQLTTRFGDEVPDGAFGRFRAALVEDMTALRTDPGAVTAATTTLAEVKMRVATWSLPEDGGMQSLAGGVQGVYRRGRRALRAAQQRPDGERLHELRKRAKDLWHGAQLLRPAAPKRMKKLARRAHQLSDLLGEDHDLLVLRQRADYEAELFEHGEPELLRALIERRRSVLERDALALASRLYARKPRKLRLI